MPTVGVYGPVRWHIPLACFWGYFFIKKKLYLCIVKQSGMNQCFTYSISSSFSLYADNHTFSAKEKDSETGLSYFGSRYYSSDLSIWLSVDPMSDKYPSLSPYTYCANNPIKLVDPNGEKVGDYRDWNGKLLGTDGINDKNVYFISDKASLKKNKNEWEKKHSITRLPHEISRKPKSFWIFCLLLIENVLILQRFFPSLGV